MEIQPAVFQRVQYQLPEYLEPLYANFSIVNYTASTFAIDFALALPGDRVHRVRARIVTSPYEAWLFMRSLDLDAAQAGHQPGRTASRRKGHNQGEASGDSPRPMLPPPTSQRAARAADSHKPEVVVPPALVPTHANLLMAERSATEAVLDFALLFPSSYSVREAARIMLPLAGLSQLLEAIEEALSGYTARYGPINPPEECGLPASLRSAATWGSSLPFALS
jgi:hypothetical protein